MGLIQDRLTQKQWLAGHKIPTLEFTAIDTLPVAKMFLDKHIKTGIVLKQRRFGYDGYGTFHVRGADELEKLWPRWGAKQANLIGEPRCPFSRELAITLVRGQDGRVCEFPLVETHQENSRCLWVKGPVRHSGIAGLRGKLRRLLSSTGYVGAIAFELFDTPKGLVVNEVAPRVHNSTHYSIDACRPDQFLAHLMAVTGAELPKAPQMLGRGFAMMNLLGRSTAAPMLVRDSGANLHWYGKHDNRPGRKMGHLNAVANSADEALRIVKRAERKFKL